jgi:hypothetical protein
MKEDPSPKLYERRFFSRALLEKIILQSSVREDSSSELCARDDM